MLPPSLQTGDSSPNGLKT